MATMPMVHIVDAIRSIPTARIFELGGCACAQFHCPGEQDTVVWTQTDYLLHVLSSRVTWKQSSGVCHATAGESVFFKKGAFIEPRHEQKDVCIEVFFIPDAIVKETVMELAAILPADRAVMEDTEQTIRIHNDAALSAFFQGMTIYFASGENPPEALLRLKIKELVTGILLGNSNPALSAYFRSLVDSDAPSIAPIMERNFQHNLPIEAFAQMCHRSLSTFKREFRKLYGTTPGKWLVERRLDHAVPLLQNTQMSITQISFECGFEDLSHFSRAFKGKFHHSPSVYRESHALHVP